MVRLVFQTLLVQLSDEHHLASPTNVTVVIEGRPLRGATKTRQVREVKRASTAGTLEQVRRQRVVLSGELILSVKSYDVEHDPNVTLTRIFVHHLGWDS